ncbi:MAG: ferrous iron transport protein A [Candidatus Cloacimonetes bacterium]|nr:ferrous iron transport protein A [Candidatus Cloacimonadota bacterium]MCK9178732.1 ferrous iron transport protein A [Candidatus Cloacimonadota bacterium]
MFGFGRKNHRHIKRRQGASGRGRPEGKACRSCICLTESTENGRYIVRRNPDLKILEMGIAPGSLIQIFQNQPKEPNLIVGVNDLRLVIPRSIARTIKVK